MNVDLPHALNSASLHFWKLTVIAVVLAVLPCFAEATTTFVYEGTLQNAEGDAVTTGGTVRIEVRSPSSTDSCLLYAETHVVPGSEKGYFSILVGKTPETLNPARTLEDALSNRTTLTADVGSCSSGTYTPLATDGRNLVVKFTPQGEATAIEFPPQALAASPYATQAKNVGGFSKDSLLRVEDAGVPGTAPSLTTAQAAALTFLAGGTSNLYEKRGQLNGLVIPTLAANQALRWDGTAWEPFTPLTSYTETDPTVKPFAQTTLPSCAPGEVLTGDGNALSCVADATGMTPATATTTTKGIVAIDATGGIAVAGGTIGLAGSGVSAGTYRKVVVDGYGRVTAGVPLASADIPSLDAAIISQGTFDPARLPAVTASMISSVSGSAITSGTIGGATAIVSTGTLSGVAVSSRSLKVRDSDDSNKITIQTPATGTLTSDYTLTLPSDDGSNGQILSTDGNGVLSWVPAGGTGTVTNVGLTLPNIFSVTGGPVTSSGTFTAALASQTQNTFWAAPNGSNGTPTFRAIAAADVPSLDAGKITSGTFAAAQIPALDAAKITSGTFATSQIPAHDASKITSGTFATAQIPALDAGKITSGTFATAQIPDLDAAKIATGTLGVPVTTSGTVAAKSLRLTGSTNGSVTLMAPASASLTLTLPAADGAPSQVLKTNGSGVLSWANDATSAGVTAVSVTSPITNTGTSAAPIIGISAASTSTNGYLSSTDWNTFNGKLAPTLAQYKVFIGNASNVATASYFGVGDLRKTDGTAQFASANCSASQTLTWSAVTDTFTCANIAIASTQVSGLGTAAAKNFGTSTGQLVEVDANGKIPLAVRSGTFSGARVSISNSGEARYHLYNGGSQAEWVMGQKTQGNPNFIISKSVSNSESHMLAIDTSGNLGIGTTSPRSNVDIEGSGAVILPDGTSTQRPTGVDGMIRYNSENQGIEQHAGGAWQNVPRGFMGAMHLTGAAGCAWGTSSTSFVTLGSSATCNSPIGYGGAGKVPAIQFPTLPPGNYEVTMQALMYADASRCYYRFTDGTNTSTALEVFEDASQLVGIFNYTTTQTNIRFTVQMRGYDGLNNCALFAEAPGIMMIYVKGI